MNDDHGSKESKLTNNWTCNGVTVLDQVFRYSEVISLSNFVSALAAIYGIVYAVKNGEIVKTGTSRLNGWSQLLDCDEVFAVGDLIEFGHYPQGRHGEVEPIVWRVLHCEADGILLLAERCLDCMPYNKGGAVSWTDCSLRRWLNSDFLARAFSEWGRSCIKPVCFDEAGNVGEDRVFLLSVEETVSLFADRQDLQAESTDFAFQKGAIKFNDDVSNGSCLWWLCNASDRGVYVDAYGRFGRARVCDNRIAVRPAIWIRPGLLL